jgi:hypothetical protein
MNERLKELVTQSKIHMVSEPRVEEFVDLIINDILEIINNPVNYNSCTYTTFDLSKGQCVASELAKRINEHFGNKQ